MMTLANKITLMRAALSIVMFLFILLPYGWARITATLIFILAASTDWVDGKIARQTNTITPFGAIVDPFVDKILVAAAFFAFVGIKELDVPIWAVFFILLRELMISTLRVIAALEGKVMAAERWGKFKTVIQMTAIGTIFFVLDVYHLSHLVSGSAQEFFQITFLTLQKVPYAITAIAAVITWISAVSYLKNNWDLLKKSWSLPVCK
ncbi:CDP-diacylglycerol--glycerol-3-phosphate 3-phosphatidyltransferase [Candidatus Avelusimicrobium fimicolum]|jgi:CDP-diacylglycerol--glycerol-3-phosphate 3-phosphatidyltransferase|uniref:CDP-diacylglycerol--glycerol-3-phosphate 3-phosphatidyltransferase n=2 Tax=Elusimicrobiaceae TaxID=641876 RepID=UPI0015A8AB2E|nr:CDP-diacylglycerol--glycerol-3-phosphate 3-phosphatidyltransferase [Elusimicrobiaceae bacterium]